MTRFRIRAAVLFALTGLFLIVLPFAVGRASDLPGAVTGVQIEQKTADQYQAFLAKQTKELGEAQAYVQNAQNSGDIPGGTQ